jgi:hypothetical protein
VKKCQNTLPVFSEREQRGYEVIALRGNFYESSLVGATSREQLGASKVTSLVGATEWRSTGAATSGRSIAMH